MRCMAIARVCFRVLPLHRQGDAIRYRSQWILADDGIASLQYPYVARSLSWLRFTWVPRELRDLRSRDNAVGKFDCAVNNLILERHPHYVRCRTFGRSSRRSSVFSESVGREMSTFMVGFGFI
jgi:hypothetical protein